MYGRSVHCKHHVHFYIFGKPHDPSAAGTLFVNVADSSTWEYHRMSTRVSRSIAGSGISPYFGVDTHRCTLELQFRYQNVLVLSNTMVQVPCLYVAPFLRYSRLPQNSPEILLLLSWTAFTGTNGKKQLYLRSGATYKHGLAPLCCTVVGGGGQGIWLPVVVAITRYVYTSAEICK